MGRIIPNIMEIKKCLKPPARYTIYEHNCSWNVQTCWNMLKLTSILDGCFMSFSELPEIARVQGQQMVPDINKHHLCQLLRGVTGWSGSFACRLNRHRHSKLRSGHQLHGWNPWKHVKTSAETQSVLGWKAMRRDKNSKLQTTIHNMGCCVLILNVGGWPPHPLLMCTVLWVSDFNQSIGTGNLLEWFKGGRTTWAALSQAAARALESCAAMLAYRTTHLPPANGPNMSASCSHKSTLEISNQENTWKYHMLTPSRNMRAV